MNDIIIRKLQESDLDNDFLESLDSLKKVSGLSHEKAKLIFKKITENSDHIIMVALSNNKVVGSITMLIESKFIHDGGLVGHIEDVVVSKDHQGKGIGKKLVGNMLEFAKEKGCYKTILDCSDDLISFYEKIGFKKYSNSMRHNHI